jgi:hypothetical protein
VLTVDDLTGLGKLAESAAKVADSKVAVRAYDDLLADAMKEGGEGLVELIKAFRLFTFPIQLLALAQDRLKRWCEEVRRCVPEERHIEAQPSIALPVLMNLRFMEEDNPLTELYLNLLARAIDKERVNEAHPAFVRIIEQLSPDEALILFILRDRAPVFFAFDSQHVLEAAVVPQDNVPSGEWNIATPVKEDITSSIPHPRETSMNLERLKALTLVFSKAVAARRNAFSLTQFGELFVKACIPEDFKL